MSENQLTQIHLSAEDLKKLSGDLDQKIKICEEYRSSWALDHKDWNDAYFMVPENETRLDPWPGASNLFMPLIRVGVDGLLAQFHDAMFSNNPFIKVRATTDEHQEAADDLSRYYGEHYYTREVPFRRIGGDYLWDTLISGTAVLKNRVDRSGTLRRGLFEQTRPKRGRPPAPGLGQRAVELFSRTISDRRNPVEKFQKEEIYIEETRSVMIENTSLEQVFIPPSAGPSMQWPECPYYYEQHFLTVEEMLSRTREGYDMPDAETLMGMAVERAGTEQKQAVEEALGLNARRNDKSIELLEFYMRVSLPAEIKFAIRAGRIEEFKGDDIKKQKFMDDDGWEEEVVVSYLPKLKRVVRVVPLDRIRGDGKRPHVDMRYTRIPRSWHGEGLPAATLNLNLGMNSFFNQMIDYGTLQNLPWIFFSPDSMGDMPENMYLEPGAMIPTADPRGVNSLRLQGDPGFWQSSINLVQAQFERVASVSDFTRGVSPTRPNAPDTARATLAMIANAQTAFDWKTADFTESYREEFRHVHELHARNLKEAVTFQFFNENTQAFENKTIQPEVFQRPVEFEFILNPSRQAEQQTNQTLFSMLSQIIMAANGGDPSILRPLAKDLWESHGKNNFEEVWPTPQAPQVAGPAPSQGPTSPSVPPPGQAQQPTGPQAPAPPMGPQAPTPPIGIPTNGGRPPGGSPPDVSLKELFDRQQQRPVDPVLTSEEEGASLN